MMKNRILSVCLACTFVLTGAFLSAGSEKTYAASVQDKINQATKDKKAALDKLNQNKEKKQEELAKKEKLDH